MSWIVIMNRSDRQEKTLTMAAFDEIFPNDEDKDDYRHRKERKARLLERRMSLRLKPEDLELRGIVPQGYFEDAEETMNGHKVRKENIIDDLNHRLAQRMGFEELKSKNILPSNYSLDSSSNQ